MIRPSSVITTFMSVSAAESSTYSRSHSASPLTIPTDTAATMPFSGLAFSLPAATSLFRASASATQAPVMEAVRVPPSAWITSQSRVMVNSPSVFRSTAARSARAIRRWISMVRPPCLPFAASRALRVWVERGSMPYSAVIQPCPWPFRKRGTPSSMEAVHNTLVSPNSTSTEPSACFV
ncbi:hypothetical protein D3C76_1271620 [compost metagenome]